MNDKINSFKSDGFIKLNNLIDTDKCKNLYLKLIENRNWDHNLFQSEEEFKEELKVNPMLKKTNPGKGIQNLVDDYNIDFIEKNPEIIKTLKRILGENYEIMLSKFVVAVPNNWLPDYVKILDNDALISKGLAREVIRRIQSKRKDLDLDLEATISLKVWFSEALPKILDKDWEYLKSETRSDMAEILTGAVASGSDSFEVDGNKIFFKVN